MAAGEEVIPPPPPGFALESSVPPPPPGFKLEGGNQPASKPLGANAGLLNFGAGVLGTPVDAIQNLLNLGIAGYGAARGALTGDGGASPEPISGAVGGSDWLRAKLRGTGIPGLSPDNPNPDSAASTLAYDLTSRGGFIPGGALPAAASVAAEKIGGPAWGAVGAMLPSAAGAVFKAAMPAPNQNAEMLAKEGVKLTPGQQYGGAVKRVEDGLTSVPILGDAIKGAQRRGVEQFDAASINRALAPIGEKLPSGITGNKAVEYARMKLGDAYESLLPNLKGDLNAGLSQDLSSIKQIAANLPNPQRGQVDRIIQREIVDRFTPAGLASGDTLKKIESELGRLGKDFSRSDNYDTRTLGGAVQEMQNSLRRMIERVNPQYRGELDKINAGYGLFKITQKAAGSLGATDGVFTPSQLNSAVKASDISKDKARFAEGTARMQDLSNAGKSVLPSSVPDSGTPLRGMLAYAAANPLKAAGLMLPVSAAALPYTQVGQSVLQSLIDAQKTPAASSPVINSGLLQSILASGQ